MALLFKLSFVILGFRYCSRYFSEHFFLDNFKQISLLLFPRTGTCQLELNSFSITFNFQVLLADNKGQSRSVSGEAKPRSRIFILVPKTMSSSEVEEEFTKFGSVDHVQILTDRSSGESKVIYFFNSANTQIIHCTGKQKLSKYDSRFSFISFTNSVV